VPRTTDDCNADEQRNSREPDDVTGLTIHLVDLPCLAHSELTLEILAAPPSGRSWRR
jgi:hypothetical protein